jgi:hypothetical protein
VSSWEFSVLVARAEPDSGGGEGQQDGRVHFLTEPHLPLPTLPPSSFSPWFVPV